MTVDGHRVSQTSAINPFHPFLPFKIKILKKTKARIEKEGNEIH